MTPIRPMPIVIYAHMASKCVEHIGPTRAAAIVGVDYEDMRRICRGDVVPTSKQRDSLDRLYATLLSHEIEMSDEAVKTPEEKA